MKRSSREPDSKRKSASFDRWGCCVAVPGSSSRSSKQTQTQTQEHPPPQQQQQMSHRRPDDAPSSLPHLPNNNNTSSSNTTAASTTTTTTTTSSHQPPSTSSAASNRPRTASSRKERILNNPPSITTATAATPRTSLHTRAVSRSSNLAQNTTTTTTTPREHTRAKSTSLSTSTSSRSRRPTPASSVVVTQHTPPSTATARAYRHTSITPPQQEPTPALVVPQHRPATSHSESLEALKARQPARFSSNGIATSTGPPPSLAYRRNVTMDNRFSPRDTRGMVRENDSSSTISHFSRSDSNSRREGRERGSSFSTKRTSIRADNRANGYPEGYEQREGAMRGLEDLQTGGVSIENGELDGGELGGEDVFLNLARSNSVSGYTENSAYRAERRRVGFIFSSTSIAALRDTLSLSLSFFLFLYRCGWHGN